MAMRPALRRTRRMDGIYGFAPTATKRPPSPPKLRIQASCATARSTAQSSSCAKSSFASPPGSVKIRLHEADAHHRQTLRRMLRQLERRPRQVSAHHDAVRAGEEQAELAGATAHLHD